MRLLIPFLILPLLATAAAATIQERSLPEGATNPMAIAFDVRGDLWITLDGPWAIIQYDTDTFQVNHSVQLEGSRLSETETLWGLRFAPDGFLWASSGSVLYRVHPETMEQEPFELPTWANLTGDLYVGPDGTVWDALVSKDVLVSFDPATNSFQTHPTPSQRFGPLSFDATPWGVFLTATYAGTVARLDPATGTITPAARDLLRGPVGITHDATHLWVAEMGASSIARVHPTTYEVERFPTLDSPFYPSSGPSGILVGRDGGVWFAEHFADRVSRLDPVARTLHEYMAPSAPVTGIQRIAQAPDGSIWFAEWDKSKVGRVVFDDGPPSFTVPSEVVVAPGESVHVDSALAGDIEFGVLDESLLDVERELGGFRVTADANATGRHNVLVSSILDRDQLGRHNAIGRYVTVVVEPESQDTPALGLGWIVLVSVAVPFLWRRSRCGPSP